MSRKLGRRYDVYQTLYLLFLHFFKEIKIKYNGDTMSKESFKTFARKYPELATSVINGKVSWQQLYELYEIYGENNDIWNDYISKKNNSNQTSLKDIFETIKAIDLNSFQEGISNIQKTIGIIQNLGIGSNKYEPKPLYQRLDDR